MNATTNRKSLDQMLVGPWITQGIYIAAELGIADRLVQEPKTARELAQLTGSHSDALYRVLRALASIGIFSEDELGRFHLTPMAEYLRSDTPDSCRAFAIMSGAEFYRTWERLLSVVQNGDESAKKNYGKNFFQYLADNPQRHRIYDAAMAGYGIAETQPMLDAYDFSQFQSIVDIGGGNGHLLASILKVHSAVKGVLYDLPPVANGAYPALEAFINSGRCQIQGGDFFVNVPAGHDAYVMRHIIHDWSDEDAVSILTRCREAMKPESKLLLVETVIPDGNTAYFGKWLDLMMLLIGGRERNEKQYRQLLAGAGLKMSRIVPTACEINVVEAVI